MYMCSVQLYILFARSMTVYHNHWSIVILILYELCHVAYANNCHTNAVVILNTSRIMAMAEAFSDGFGFTSLLGFC